MDVKKIMLLIGALVVAAITAVMAKNMFSGAGAPVAQATPVVQPTGPEVLVATRSLPVGTILDAGALRYERWPQSLTQPAYFIKGQTPAGPADLIGTVVRSEITAGQPITQGSLVKPGDRGFLAAALGPGMRAITVPVSVTSGVAGFIFPGDRVDIVLTQEVAGGEGSGPPLKASETVFRNIRVLATDQRMSAEGQDGKPEVKNFSTVTLEATPKIAEKIAVAQTIGQLSLSLRSIADNNVDLERAIASGEVKVPTGTDPKAERQMLIQIASRPVDTTPTYTVGAEVSRFQRATVPSSTKPAASSGSGNTGSVAPVLRSEGPVIRVARGNIVTVVPVGAK